MNACSSYLRLLFKISTLQSLKYSKYILLYIVIRFFCFFSLQVRHLNYRRKLYQKILIPRFLCLNDFELWFFLLFFFKKDGGSNLIDKSWFKLMEVIYTV